MATKKKSPSLKKKIARIPKKSLSKKVSFRRKTDFVWNSSGAHSLLVKHPSSEVVSGSPYRRKSDLVRCKDLSDSELITVIYTQNVEAFKELFSRYQKKLFSYIFHLVGSRSEAEDILQNVFSKAYNNIKKFDVTRKFSSWIYRIAHNESINFLKRKNKRYTVSWDDVTSTKDKLDTATNGEIPEEKWEQLEIIKEIDEALGKLPPKYQQVLKLRYFQEYSYEEISDILGKPVNTIGTLINRAKKKLLEVTKK